MTSSPSPAAAPPAVPPLDSSTGTPTSPLSAAVDGAARRGDARRRITHAAMDLFERQGYAAATVDAITEQAGVARRTFFHHFSS